MKKIIKIYLDTSVISALYDDRNPERQELTAIFFEKIDDFDVFISEIVLAEIERIKTEDLKKKMRKRAINYKILKINEATRKLASEYIKNNAIPEAYSEDALHIAISTLNNIDYLLSWNFRHIVKEKTRKIINMVNLSQNYPKLKIITPAELL